MFVGHRSKDTSSNPFFNNPKTQGRENVNRTKEDWDDSKRIEKSDIDFRMKVFVPSLILSIALFGGGITAAAFGLKNDNLGLYFGGSFGMAMPGLFLSPAMGIFIVVSRTRFNDPEERARILKRLMEAKSYGELPSLSENMVRYGFLTSEDAKEIKSKKEEYVSKVNHIIQLQYNYTHRLAMGESFPDLTQARSELESMNSGFNAWHEGLKTRIATYVPEKS